jgi:4-diphosphocytidyl-2-C-methyl-D-erythritol kinase
MEQITVKARAKINVALDVVGKRADGYHELKTVMQTLYLHDVVTIKKVRKENYLKLSCSKDWLPTDERNLAYRAADYMLKTYGLDSGVYIELEKNIPVAAGLAGGSSDCAAVLVGMRNLYNLPLSLNDLAETGVRFGADVPYCVKRGTMLAEGIGERLTRLPPFPDAHVLLVKPPVSVSTAEVFGEYVLENRRIEFDGLLKFIAEKNLCGICSMMENALESVTARKFGIITDIKETMAQNGALGCLMSGSGPTVFGLFDGTEDVRKAANAVRARFPEIKDIIPTRIFNVT